METTTHMLGVPPKSSRGATNRCVMSRLTKCAAPDPFQTALSQACRARSCRSCGGAGVHRLCALRSRALSVERGFCASLFGVALGALDGEVQQLARGRVDPSEPTANGRSPTVRRQARYCRVEIQKSAMTAVPGAGIGVGVCTQTEGCGGRPNRVDQAIATPGNTATSATKYCARNSLAIVVPAAWHKASA